MMAPLTALNGGQPSGPEVSAPQSIDAEQALLGAVLLNNAALDLVSDFLVAEDFSEPAHQKIYAAMIARRDAGELSDWKLLRTILGDAPFGCTTVSGYLARLVEGATTITGVKAYGLVIVRAARMRAVLAAAHEAVAAMSSGAIIDPAGFAAGMIETLDGIASAGLAETARRVTLAEGTSSVLARIDRVRRGLVPPGVPFGLPALDKATLGLRPGQLVILAGRPGMGKTTVAASFALAAARGGKAVGVISLEMDALELSERVLAALAYDPRRPAIAYRAIAEAVNLSDEALERVAAAEWASRQYLIWVEQQPALTLAQIAARARQMRVRADREGKPFAALFVDHIGLVRPSQRYGGNRTAELTEITGGLKALAKELAIPIVALSQLNRQVEGREDKRPQLADLRDSGSIEQDADVVLGLYREAYYRERQPNRTEEDEVLLADCQNELEIEILKQRSGPTTRITCFCDVACNVLAEART